MCGTLVAWPMNVARAESRTNFCADAAEHGQELRDGHKLVEARAEFLACAQRDCPGIVRASCTEWLADLDARIPSLVVAAKDEDGHDIVGLGVWMDGAPLSENVTSSAVFVNPGTYTLRYTATGYLPVEESTILREGEPVRVLAVTLRRVSPRTEAAAARDTASPTATRPLPAFPLALGAASVVALTVFGYYAIKGASEYRRLERDCSPRCATSELDGVRSTFLVADVAVIAGLVTGAGAATLWFVGRSATPTRATATRR
jgi:hypothetical protein